MSQDILKALDEAGGGLPPFMGYLPPVVDRTLLELMNMSYPDYPPRAGRTGAELSEPRLLALDSLRVYFREKPHLRAAESVARAANEQTPFCLYLRNFELGPRVYEARNDPYGLPQVVTLTGQYDNNMQHILLEVVEPLVPVVGIQNPAGRSGPLASFVVADEDWEPLAHSLVHNAGMIVLYFRGATAGVAQELELIRAEHKQAITLVVIEEEDPIEALGDMAAMAGAKRDAPVHVAASLDDFPHRLNVRGSKGAAALKAELAKMARGPLAHPMSRQILLPPEFLPPEPLRNYCTDQATEEFDKGMKLISEKRFDEAEDILYRAVAYAHWARSPLGRVMTLSALAGLSWNGFGARGDAGSLYEMALDICEEIKDTSQTAAELYPRIKDSLKRLRAESEARVKARSEAAPKEDQ